MQSPPNWSRRNFLSTRGLASSAGGLLGSLFRDAGARVMQEPDGPGHWVVAHRAMACEFSIYLPPTVAQPYEVGDAALAVIDEMEDLLTVYRDDTPISYVNQNAATAPVRVEARLYEVLKRAAEISRLTGGAFDATAGALVKAWGFFRGPRHVPEEAIRLDALACTGVQHVRFNDEEMSVAFDVAGLEYNLGSIGKGYAIDQAVRHVRNAHGVTTCLMQGGQSSLFGLGCPRGQDRGWLIGIENPFNPRETLAQVRLFNRGMGTSGTANQYFEHAGRLYGHVLDPRTGWPADELASVSVIAADSATADALSTGLFVLGLDKAITFCENHPEVAALIVLKPDVPVCEGRPRVLTLNLSPRDVSVPPEHAIQATQLARTT